VLLILLVNTIFAVMNTAATGNDGVNILLRNGKSGSPFSLRFCNNILLFLDGGKRGA
jgi:hypothetical protein